MGTQAAARTWGRLGGKPKRMDAALNKAGASGDRPWSLPLSRSGGNTNPITSAMVLSKPMCVLVKCRSSLAGTVAYANSTLTNSSPCSLIPRGVSNG